MEKLNIIIRNVSEKMLWEYSKTGMVRDTFNGPYHDDESKARAISHLIVSAYYEIVIFNNESYVKVLMQLGDELIKSFDNNGLIKIRMKENKDSCNGVIGHAWILQAITCLYKYTKDKKYIYYGNEIVKNHIYSTKKGMWLIPEIAKIDATFNHQLWYAACLLEYATITENIEQVHTVKYFLENNNCIQIAYNGRIRHLVKENTSMRNIAKRKIKNLLNDIHFVLKRPSLVYKECGYHIFNMTAFAIIHRYLPEIELWKTKKFNKTIKFINSKTFIRYLESTQYNLDNTLLWRSVNNKTINYYGYPYNVPGFEIDFVAEEFRGIDLKVIRLIRETQIKTTYDFAKEEFGKNCEDCNIINYRTYEFYMRYIGEEKND